MYAWDTPENSDEEEPFIKPKLQFEIWCEKQHAFMPKNSIFLHYLKDKHPEIDHRLILNLADTVLARVLASIPPDSSSRSSSESPPDAPATPDGAASMEWDNYALDPSFERSPDSFNTIMSLDQLSSYPTTVEVHENKSTDPDRVAKTSNFS